MKVYVVGGSNHYACFLKNAELVDKLEEADVVLFTGGEDVSPSVYGCQKHPKTYCSPKRDKEEKEIFNKVKRNQVCLGICRGSQLLCALNGGILVQHCTGHALGSTHPITNGSMVYEITSTHHQMQYPYNLSKLDYDLLYWSKSRLSDRYEGDQVETHSLWAYGEPEIVLYHKKNLPECLAVQGHPEMIPNSPVAEMVNNLVERLVYENN